MSSIHDLHDSDSENDPDYAPEDVNDSDESDDEGKKNEGKDGTGKDEEEDTEEAHERRKRERALWASFTAGSSTPKEDEAKPVAIKMVKIEKRYRFAGEDVVDIVEVPEDSEEARKWPRWVPFEETKPSDGGTEAPLGQAVTRDIASATTLEASKTPSSSGTPLKNVSEASSTVASTSASPVSVVKPTQTATSSQLPTKRPPGPRKPKTLLTSSTPKPKKLSTLEKSAMDWKAHLESEAAVTDADEGGVGTMRDELEANRRGGGYLEKVDFLDRVGARREELFEKERSLKRRKAG